MANLLRSTVWDLALNTSDVLRMGGHGWYWRLHLALARAYAHEGALAVTLREAEQTGLSRAQLTYGETPAVSMLGILSRANVGPGDVLYDLGCGRGLALLAAALRWPIMAVGIDAIPTFTQRGTQLAQHLGIGDRVQFVNGNFLDQDLSAGTVFYAAATTFEPRVIEALARRVAEQTRAHGHTVRFVTLSQVLPYPWRLVGKGHFPMTWGWNSVYFHDLAATPDACEVEPP